jgi:hypothetical protein
MFVLQRCRKTIPAHDRGESQFGTPARESRLHVPPLDWLTSRLAHVSGYELAVNVPYAVAFACVGAEVAWLACRRQGATRTAVLRSAATATTMAAGALLVGVLYTALLRFLRELVATQRWDGAAAFWQHHTLVGAAELHRLRHHTQTMTRPTFTVT